MSDSFHIRNVAVVGWEQTHLPLFYRLASSSDSHQIDISSCNDWLHTTFESNIATFSINLIQPEKLSVESLSLPLDGCFEAVDGLILVLNCATIDVVCGAKSCEENIFSAFVESVLNCVKTHQLSLIVYLDGFDKTNMKSKLKSLVDLVNMHDIVDFSLERVIVGNCVENYAVRVVPPHEKLCVRNHLLNAVVKLVPSPVQSQKTYQFENLVCFGKHEAFDAIENCSQGGTLVIHGIGMIPHISKPNRCNLLCKVLSGSAVPGKKVKILQSGGAVIEKVIQTISIYQLNENGQKADFFHERDDIEPVVCGTIIMIGGLDLYIQNDALLLEHDAVPTPREFKASRYIHSTTLFECHISFNPQLEKALSLQRLTSQKHSISFTHDDYSGTLIISTRDHNLIMKVAQHVKEIQQELGIENVTLTITSKIMETMSGESDVILCKAPNKHTRLYFRGAPLTEEDHVEKYPFGLSNNKRLAYVIRYGSNLIVNRAFDACYLNEVIDAMNGSAKAVLKCGVLCEGEVVNTKYYIQDVKLYTDAIHRGSGQIIPTMRRVLYGCLLSGGVRLVEGLLNVHVIGREEDIVKVVSLLKEMNSMLEIDNTILSGSEEVHNPIVNIHCKIRTSEFVELFAKLEEMKSSGSVISIYSHSNGELIEIEGDPFEEGTKANQIVKRIREMKGLPSKLPELNTYSDKL